MQGNFSVSCVCHEAYTAEDKKKKKTWKYVVSKKYFNSCFKFYNLDFISYRQMASPLPSEYSSPLPTRKYREGYREGSFKEFWFQVILGNNTSHLKNTIEYLCSVNTLEKTTRIIHQISSPYHAVNILCLSYKNQSVNVV